MKYYISISFLLISLHVALAQAPANDDCSGLINLGVVPYCSTPAQYTNIGATLTTISTTNNVPSCFNGLGERDVWFQFTLPADGSIDDVEISVFGNIDGNGTLEQPQIALYRGDCMLDGLDELACIAAAPGSNSVDLTLLNLTPGLSYYLRINDYSATAGTNSGTFKLCVQPYVPDINIGEEPSSESCTGTLWDSGGPTGDYAELEDLEFSICPQEFHQCIILNVENYDIESNPFGGDYLQFYAGPNSSTGVQITQISGMGTNFEVQISSPCATVRFTSDFGVELEGFELTWTCSPDACTSTPLTTCEDPITVNLPYVANGLNNCFSGNSIDNSPCGNNAYLQGNDYVFEYISQGDECINIVTSGTIEGAGIGVFLNCPEASNTLCITDAGGGFGISNPAIPAAFLENAGTYYIVFGAGQNCSPFNIAIDTVACPIVLPPASTCDNALSLNGCSNNLPEIIALNPGSGDPDFIQAGVNDGCFLNPMFNYSFFYFVAEADGQFGFIVESADPNEASDIDLSVWGPIDNVADICEYTSTTQPVRSTWTGGTGSTGLIDINPENGDVVTDDYDCGNFPGAGGDRYVRRLDVVQGKIYVVMLDDFGEAIENGGISINFQNTTDGVLGVSDLTAITVTPDTAICVGQQVQLNATGGEAYYWSPSEGLSCDQCPNPVATPTDFISYTVQVVTTCNTVNKVVDVRLVDVELGPDVTVCNNASFTLNPNPYNISNAQYVWVGGAGLSCYDCASPVVSGLTTGIYTFIVNLTTPGCSVSDTIKISVINGTQPTVTVSEDQSICLGESVPLGGDPVAGVMYSWTSVPTGFSAAISNPSATPVLTTQYFVSATNGSCPIPTIDSVLIAVFTPPVLSVLGDMNICQGQSVILGTTSIESGVTYAWIPDDGSIDAPNTANPTATPESSTSYTLTASNLGCIETRIVDIIVSPISLVFNVGDTVLLCKGTNLDLAATITPVGATINWSPLTSLQLSPDGLTAIAYPVEDITYTATVLTPGCVISKSIFVKVDSLPDDLSILPADTTICKGQKVFLLSKIYEPAEYQDITFEWTPFLGQLTPDSLYNMVSQPDTTVMYQRISVNGGCRDTAFATVNVIIPPEMYIQPADTTVCPGQSVQLTLFNSEGVENLMWQPSSSLSCSSNCTNPVATPDGTTNYTVGGTYQSCPVGAGATVKVGGPPTYAFPTDLELCGGESIILNTMPEPGAIYTWTSTDPNFGTVVDPQLDFIPTQTATYFLSATNGCAVQASVTVTVYNSSLSVDGDTTICKGFSAPLVAIGSLPGSFIWNNTINGQAINVMPDITTTYTVVYSYGQDCVLSDFVTVTVQGEAAEVNFPSDKGLCPGESIALNDVATPGAIYVWTSEPPGFNFTGAIPPIQTPTLSTKYLLMASLGDCVFNAEVNVVVYDGTLVVSADTTICFGESIKLSAQGSVTGTYVWAPNNVTGPELNDTPAQTSTYEVIYTYGDGCTLTETIQVGVTPMFEVNIVSDPDTNQVNLGQQIKLTGLIDPSQSLQNFTFMWIQDGNTNLGNTESINVKIITKDSTISYLLMVTSPLGCKEQAIITFKVLQPKVVFPNIFSPNNDTQNDKFEMVVLEGLAIIDEMSIFNRWGQKVYQSTEPNAAWDGKVDGKDAPTDTYVYMIKWRSGDGALQPFVTGEINLIR